MTHPEIETKPIRAMYSRELRVLDKAYWRSLKTKHPLTSDYVQWVRIGLDTAFRRVDFLFRDKSPMDF